MSERLRELTPDMPIIYGGDRVTSVPAALAEAFQPGDRLLVVQTDGALLHLPGADHAIADAAVGRAYDAFLQMGTVVDEQISAFYDGFARRLADDAAFAAVAAANRADVERAKGRGRSTTRLSLSDQMRHDMIAGLHSWRDAPSGRGGIVETVVHDRWRVDQIRSGLGVVGFVFEGRPNVFADATGVLRAGNTVVFRIGSDALGTAEAIVEHALDPAIAEAGLPTGAASLVATPSRAAGWGMFSDPRLALAVARGSGKAVAQLGAVARQAGIPVSLHGTGGAWMVAARSAEPAALGHAVYHSLDRKVCNTLNTVCVVAERAAELVPVFLDALDRAGQRRSAVSKLHVTEAARGFVPRGWFEAASISRADGSSNEPRCELIGGEQLGQEWEWEDSPEVTLHVVDDVSTAVELFNQQSPRFVASLIASDEAEHQRFFDTIDSPFVGNAFTRWVDGQYALNRPELGLSNWQGGRLFARGGVLSGDSVFTLRCRATHDDPNTGR